MGFLGVGEESIPDSTGSLPVAPERVVEEVEAASARERYR